MTNEEAKEILQASRRFLPCTLNVAVALGEAINALDQRATAQWTPGAWGNMNCSRCGMYFPAEFVKRPEIRFCPSCGARMINKGE